MISVISDCVLATVRVAEGFRGSFIACFAPFLLLRLPFGRLRLRVYTIPATMEEAAGESASQPRCGTRVRHPASVSAILAKTANFPF
jgi:hypothetical protein